MLAPATSIVLTAIQQGQIEKLTRDGGTPQRVAARYRIILLARQGKTNVAIAGQLGLSRPTVLAAHAAFAQNGLNAIIGVRKRKRSARFLTPELTQRILEPAASCRIIELQPLCAAKVSKSSLRNLSRAAEGSTIYAAVRSVIGTSL